MRRHARRCQRQGCKEPLRGVRAHGWPSKDDGRAILCDGCGNPQPRKRRHPEA